MVNIRSSLVTTALVHAAFAFAKTSPLVAWSSSSSQLIATASNTRHVEGLFDSYIYNDNVCNYDAVVLVDQPGLHASDLRALPSSSALTKMIDNAPSSIQYPSAHIPAGASRDRVVGDIVQRCGSRVLGSAAEVKALHQEDISGSKSVVNVQMPSVQQSSESRKSQMTAYSQHLAEELESLTSAFPSHLIIYSDWNNQHSHFSRQANVSVPSNNSTLPAGGILKRYQLLSPGLILSLLLAFFVLIPILMVGISALASIQSPARLDGKMLAEYRQKKNQ